MYSKINLFLPTRGRVENGKLPRCLKSCMDYVSNPDNVMITFLVDKDDKTTLNYIRNKAMLPFEYIVVINDKIKKPHLAKYYNYIYKHTPFKNTVISMFSDDMAWETQDFDRLILDKINKHKGRIILWCDDCFIQHGKLPVNLFTTREMVKKTGKPFMCENFKSYFIDTVWGELAKLTGWGCYMSNVRLKHYHYTRNPRRADSTSKRLKKVQVKLLAGKTKAKKYAQRIYKDMKKRGVA